MAVYQTTQHNKTGLKYFGKTIRKDPIKYQGSGTYWTNHLNVHGNDVTTIWCQLFTDKSELTKFAMKFSNDNNIVESTEWANLQYEDGLSGSGFKRKNSEETIEKRRIKNTGKKRTLEQCERMRQAQLSKPKKIISEEEHIRRSLAQKGRHGGEKSEEHKMKISKSLKGKKLGVPKSPETRQKMRKPKSEEHKKAISEARIKKYAELRALTP